MKLQTIVYVASMEDSIRWFSELLAVEPTVRSDHWTSFEVGGGYLALHLAGDGEDGDDVGGTGAVALSLVVDEPLEAVAERVAPTRPIADEPFGRSFVVTDPDGNRIQVNEHG